MTKVVKNKISMLSINFTMDPLSIRNVYHMFEIFVFVILQASGASPSSKGEQQHHEPMVAMICPGKQGSDSRLFHNQYINPFRPLLTSKFVVLTKANWFDRFRTAIYL